MSDLRLVRSRDIPARIADRLAELEERMVQGMHDRAAAKWARDRWGISRRHADRYVTAVHDIWRAEAAKEDPQGKRARFRAMLGAHLEACYARNGFYVDKKGNHHEPHDPDLHAAGKALEMIDRFEGILEPAAQNTQILVSADLLPALQRHYGMEPEIVEAAVKSLEESTEQDEDDE